jgi:hypothetical protein
VCIVSQVWSAEKNEPTLSAWYRPDSSLIFSCIRLTLAVLNKIGARCQYLCQLKLRYSARYIRQGGSAVHGMLQAQVQSSLRQSSERRQCKDPGTLRMLQEPDPRSVLDTETLQYKGPRTSLRLGQSWMTPGSATRL